MRNILKTATELNTEFAGVLSILDTVVENGVQYHLVKRDADVYIWASDADVKAHNDSRNVAPVSMFESAETTSGATISGSISSAPTPMPASIEVVMQTISTRLEEAKETLTPDSVQSYVNNGMLTAVSTREELHSYEDVVNYANSVTGDAKILYAKNKDGNL